MIRGWQHPASPPGCWWPDCLGTVYAGWELRAQQGTPWGQMELGLAPAQVTTAARPHRAPTLVLGQLRRVLGVGRCPSLLARARVPPAQSSYWGGRLCPPLHQPAHCCLPQEEFTPWSSRAGPTACVALIPISSSL